MDKILDELQKKERLFTTQAALQDCLVQNASEDVVLFWFHPACGACCEAMLHWYRVSDEFNLLGSGKVLFVQWSGDMMHRYAVNVIPSITVLKAGTGLNNINMFQTRHTVAVHGNTTLADIAGRYDIRM